MKKIIQKIHRLCRDIFPHCDWLDYFLFLIQAGSVVWILVYWTPVKSTAEDFPKTSIKSEGITHREVLYLAENFDEVCRRNGWIDTIGSVDQGSAPAWLQWEAARIKSESRSNFVWMGPFLRVPETADHLVIQDDPVAEFTFDVIMKSRDEIKGFDSNRKKTGSSRKIEYFSLDFNRWKSTSKTFLVTPEKPSQEYIDHARDFVDRFSITYCTNQRPGGKNGSGLATRSENKRGIHGVTHVEAFDGLDKTIVDRIQANPAEFAEILADTLGRIPGATFIAPHEIDSPGANSYHGISERDFALTYTLPALLAIKQKTKTQTNHDN
jgi:hypothetical protein